MFARTASLATVLALSASVFAAPETYEIDPVHSNIVFKATHVGVAPFYGLIVGPTGTIVMDDEDPTKSSVHIEGKVDNIYTGNPKRDDHLRSEDFFSGKQYPTITFKSKSVKRIDENTAEVTGDLTFHGITKPITVKVEKTGEGDKGPKLGHRAGWQTTFTIQRSDFDFGSKFGPEMLGEEVTMMVGLEGVRK